MNSPASNNDSLAMLRAGKLAGTKRLDLSCGLRQFPTEIYDLADSLEVLNLSGNNLSSLPNDFARLTKLKVLFCSNNQFTHVPEILGQCQELSMVGFKTNQISTLPAAALPNQVRWLILTDNKLDFLPPSLGQCANLQKLMLAGNQLEQLPDEMAACEKLELLRISANRFTSLPEWLFSLPRLAWLAYAGNPLSLGNESVQGTRHQIFSVDWANLLLQQKLGEGASGIIYQALWHRTADHAPTVAVKLFKGAVTSDGLPHSEMSACIAAGSHPHLTTVEGKVSNHPDNAEGLIMSLIDPSFKNLADPPNLASCTRDIYPNETRFSFNHALSIALGIASAMQHLHTKGIMHGDLYAHNILHNDRGNCLLSDFGAASFLPQENVSYTEALQRIEVRAFACLLEELMERCDVLAESQGRLDAMRALQHDCEKAKVATRPLFTEITQRLIAI